MSGRRVSALADAAQPGAESRGTRRKAGGQQVVSQQRGPGRVLILDTAALVAFLAGSDALAEEVRATTAGRRLAAPSGGDLACVELLHELVRARRLPAGEAEHALQLLGAMRIRRYDQAPLLPRAWQLRHTLRPYDAACVALAETLGAELVTIDGTFSAARGITCTVRDLRQPSPTPAPSTGQTRKKGLR